AAPCACGGAIQQSFSTRRIPAPVADDQTSTTPILPASVATSTVGRWRRQNSGSGWLCAAMGASTPSRRTGRSSPGRASSVGDGNGYGFRLERRHPMSDMDDLHEEEYQAEVQTYILWCEGRLEELRREGLVVGQSALTESGWSKYGKLVASG